MNLHWLRLLGAAIVAEIIPIVLLVVLVALFGPGDAAAGGAFAASLGQWVGPIAGALAAFLMAWWVARPLEAGHVLQGGLLGLLVALIDAGLLVAGGAAFQGLFVLSGIGRIVAGLLGGYVAGRRSHPPQR